MRRPVTNQTRSPITGDLSYQTRLGTFTRWRKHFQKQTDKETQVGVVAADGDAGLRMFAMSRRVVHKTSPLKIVIRRNSCLQCCLQLCSKGQIFFAVC